MALTVKTAVQARDKYNVVVDSRFFFFFLVWFTARTRVASGKVLTETEIPGGRWETTTSTAEMWSQVCMFPLFDCEGRKGQYRPGPDIRL